MEQFDGLLFDCDNHYYEAEDAFTRYVPKRMQKRCVQWVEMDGKRYHLVAGKLSHAVGNPTFNPVSKPGVLREYYQGNPDGKTFIELTRSSLEPMPAEYMDRDVRVERIEKQGLEGSLALPNRGNSLRAGSWQRHRGVVRDMRRLQPLARGRLGVCISRQTLCRSLY